MDVSPWGKGEHPLLCVSAITGSATNVSFGKWMGRIAGGDRQMRTP